MLDHLFSYFLSNCALTCHTQPLYPRINTLSPLPWPYLDLYPPPPPLLQQVHSAEGCLVCTTLFEELQHMDKDPITQKKVIKAVKELLCSHLGQYASEVSHLILHRFLLKSFYLQFYILELY